MKFFAMRNFIFLSSDLESTQNSTPNSYYTHHHRQRQDTLDWSIIINVAPRPAGVCFLLAGLQHQAGSLEIHLSTQSKSNVCGMRVNYPSLLHPLHPLLNPEIFSMRCRVQTVIRSSQCLHQPQFPDVILHISLFYG